MVNFPESSLPYSKEFLIMFNNVALISPLTFAPLHLIFPSSSTLKLVESIEIFLLVRFIELFAIISIISEAVREILSASTVNTVPSFGSPVSATSTIFPFASTFKTISYACCEISLDKFSDIFLNV